MSRIASVMLDSEDNKKKEIVILSLKLWEWQIYKELSYLYQLQKLLQLQHLVMQLES